MISLNTEQMCENSPDLVAILKDAIWTENP